MGSGEPQTDEQAGGLASEGSPEETHGMLPEGGAPAQSDSHRVPDGAGADTNFRARLADWGLDGYADALQERGYDEQVLSMLSVEEVAEMLDVISCPPGHRVRFRRMLS